MDGDRDFAQKTCFITTQTHNQFPPDFMNSRNKRYIEIRQCRLQYTNSDNAQYLIGDVAMHASFIIRNNYVNSFCCFVNEFIGIKPKKFEYSGLSTTFDIWFSMMGTDRISDSTLATDYKFVLELLLIY
jgi:hypothetical protein